MCIRDSSRTDSVSGNQILAVDEFFLVSSISVSQSRRDTVPFQCQILKGCVVFDRSAEPGLRVLPDVGFGLALVVREDAVVARIDRCVIETRPNLGALS